MHFTRIHPWDNQTFFRDDIRQEELDGKTYDLVHIKESLQDKNHTRNTYTIIGGFNGYPAHMRCVQIDTQSEGERVLQEFTAQVRDTVKAEISIY